MCGVIRPRAHLHWCAQTYSFSARVPCKSHRFTSCLPQSACRSSYSTRKVFQDVTMPKLYRLCLALKCMRSVWCILTISVPTVDQARESWGHLFNVAFFGRMGTHLSHRVSLQRFLHRLKIEHDHYWNYTKCLSTTIAKKRENKSPEKLHMICLKKMGRLCDIGTRKVPNPDFAITTFILSTFYSRRKWFLGAFWILLNPHY